LADGAEVLQVEMQLIAINLYGDRSRFIDECVRLLFVSSFIAHRLDQKLFTKSDYPFNEKLYRFVKRAAEKS